MTPPIVVASALLGVACGPWLRAAVFRHSGPDWEPRRHCPHCTGPVTPGGLAGRRRTVPASARCPGCRGRLGPRAGTVELATAAVFGLLAVRADSVPLLVALCWFGACAVALSAVDVAVHRLPDVLTLGAGGGLLVGFTVAALVEHRVGSFGRACLGGLVLFAAYLVLAMASPGSLGFGDCKLAAGLGTVLGWFGWSAVLAGTVVAFALAGGFGFALVALGRAGRRDPVAFGPFMLLGALAAVLGS
ncbi:MAG TPA: A24 family peptidase [Mycobacteriales bacterium]